MLFDHWSLIIPDPKVQSCPMASIREETWASSLSPVHTGLVPQSSGTPNGDHSYNMKKNMISQNIGRFHKDVQEPDILACSGLRVCGFVLVRAPRLPCWGHAGQWSNPSSIVQVIFGICLWPSCLLRHAHGGHPPLHCVHHNSHQAASSGYRVRPWSCCSYFSIHPCVRGSGNYFRY